MHCLLIDSAFLYHLPHSGTNRCIQFYNYSPGSIKDKSTQIKRSKMYLLLSERQRGVYSDLLVEENKY